MSSLNSSARHDQKPRKSKKRESEAKKLFKTISEDEIVQSPFFKPHNGSFGLIASGKTEEELKDANIISKTKKLLGNKHPQQESFHKSDKIISEISFDGREKGISFKNLQEDINNKEIRIEKGNKGPDIEINRFSQSEEYFSDSDSEI